MVAAAATEVAKDAVPRGFRQTEFGLIPEDWEVVKLGDISTPVRGGSPRPAGDRRFFYGSYIPWLTVASLTNIPESQIVVSETTSALTLEGAKRSRIIERGCVIIANSGATLGVAKLLAIRCCANDGIAALLNLAKQVEPCFVIHYINSLTDELRERTATGNGQPNLNTDLIGQIQIPLPPLPEQKAIAGALSDADGAILAVERALAKQRAVKQAALQALLTPTTRLPGFSGDWETKTLGECADIRSGGTPSTSNASFWDGGVPWCTPTDITALKGHKHIGKTANTISDAGLKSSSAEIIPAYSLIFTSRATIGESAINLIPISTNQGFKNLVPSKELDIDFLYYRMQTYRDALIALCGGSTFLEIGKAQLAKFEISLPPLPEQRAIAAVLSDMDAAIAALEVRRDKLKAVKQGMMQTLLTGKVRLV